MSETKRPRLCLADDSLFEEHVSPPGHPERPQRLSAAREGVEACPAAAGAGRLAPRDATLDELSRASLWVRLQLSPFCPGVGLIVMIHVA